MGLVFHQSSVANLAVSEQSLDDEEDVLHLASNPGFLILYGSIPIKAGCLALPTKPVAGIRAVIDLGKVSVCLYFRSLCKPRISGVSVQNFVIRTDQKRHNIAFARVRCRYLHRVNISRPRIHADV